MIWKTSFHFSWLLWYTSQLPQIQSLLNGCSISLLLPESYIPSRTPIRCLIGFGIALLFLLVWLWISACVLCACVHFTDMLITYNYWWTFQYFVIPETSVWLPLINVWFYISHVVYKKLWIHCFSYLTPLTIPIIHLLIRQLRSNYGYDYFVGFIFVLFLTFFSKVSDAKPEYIFYVRCVFNFLAIRMFCTDQRLINDMISSF